jgi:hypothetical protein
MLNKAFEKVLKVENVKQRDAVLFRLTYEKSFLRALNTKRSSCEQAGAKIARTWIAKYKKKGEPFFTIDELVKLRRAETDREKAAFFWFFNQFLECVCGAKSWRTQKMHQLISEARDEHNLKIVTKSDEAFGLLMLDNYLEKWTTKTLAEEDASHASAINICETTIPVIVATSKAAATVPVTTKVAFPADPANVENKRKLETKKMPGKYTEKKKTGSCKFSGWSPAGMLRFNELHHLVTQDRVSAKAEEMERALLDFCKLEAKIMDVVDTQSEDHTRRDRALELVNATPVEAAWDSDND